MDGRRKNNKENRVERKKRAKKPVFHPLIGTLNRRLVRIGATGALLVGLFANPAFLLAADDTLKPDWNSPQTPHNQQGSSGIINLGEGGSYANGYNGTSLRYYFNDDGWVLDKQKIILEETLAKAIANEASAVAAEGVAIADLLPAPIALATVALAMATADVAIAKESLDLFNSYTLKTVNAVDYSGSLTVNGYGTLGGTYQNIETMTLTTTGGEGEVKLDGGSLDTIQSLKSAQEFVVTEKGEVYNVETGNFAGSLSNDGVAVYVGNLKVGAELRNGGKMAYVGPIEAGTLTNKEGGKMLSVEAIDAQTLVNDGEIVVDDLHFGDATNRGSLTVLCQTTGKTLNTDGEFKSAGSVDVNTITTGKDSYFLSKGNVTAEKFMSHGKTIVQGSVNVANLLDVEGDWTSVGDISAKDVNIDGGFISIGNVEQTGKLTVGDAGDAFFNGSLRAASVQNDGKIKLGDAMTIAGATNQGQNGVIEGTSASSSLKTQDLSGGQIKNIRTIEVGGTATNVAITANGAGSSAKFGAFSGTSSISDVGAMTVTGKTSTTGAISGAGLGSSLNLLDDATVGAISNFSEVGAAKSLAATSVEGAGVGASASVGGDLNVSGDVQKLDKLIVGGNATLAQLVGTGEDSTYKVNGNLSGFTSISDVETLVVGGTTTVGADATVKGTGAGSKFKTQTLAGDGGAMSGRVENFERLDVENDLTNKGAIVGSGAGSHFVAQKNVANEGEIKDYEYLETGALENKEGATIAGTDEGSILKADSIKNGGDIGSVETISVDGAIENAQGATITGTDQGSVLKADSIANSGTVERVEKIGVAGALENASGATIAGIGAGSTVAAGSMNNSGDVADVETVEIAGALENASGATITGTGAGSTVKADSVTNSGAVSDVESVSVAGALENASGATIAGTGAGSTVKADSVTNSGAVSGVEAVEIAGALENASGATITGSGVGSTVTAGSVTNSGDVTNVEAVSVAGALDNAAGATITGTGAGSSVKADSVTNSGAVSGVEAVEVSGALTNASGATIAGSGAGSTVAAGSMNNSGDVTNVEAVEVSGALENASGATITGSGAGSTVAADSMTNSGAVAGVEKIEVAGALENASGATMTGTGAGSAIKANALVNNGDITDVEAFDIAGATENAAGATITGSGAGANGSVVGDMTNAGTYGGFDKTTVDGNLTNTGEFEVGDKTSVTGDFTNDGGTLKTELYGDSIGSVAVDGSATVNGGTLAIDATGEKMQVGKYYYAIATDGGLTVESELTIDEDGSAPKLFHVEGFYDENNYYVGLRRDQEYGSDPQSGNEASFGQYLDDVSYLLDADDPFYENSDVVKVLSALDEATKADPDAGRAQAQSMDGEVFADMGYATVLSSLRAHERVVDSLRPNLYLVCEECGNLRHGDVCEHCGSEEPSVLSVYPYPEEASFGRRFWGVVFGSFDSIKSYDGARGFKTDAAGTAFGTDFYRNAATRIGVYGVFQDVTLKGKGKYVRERANVDAYQLGAYCYRENTLGAFLGTATVGVDRYKTGRVWNWSDASLARTHRAKTRGAELAVRMEEYANVRLGESIWQPYVAGSFAYATVDGSREKTSSGANEGGTYVTQLHNREFDVASLRSDLGLRGSYCWTGFNGKPVALRGRASWVHEFCDTNASVVNSFTGTRDGFQQTEYQPSNPNGLNDLRYSVSSVDMGRDYAWLGIGLVGDGIYDVVSLFGGYDCLFNGRAASHNIHIGVDCEW